MKKLLVVILLACLMAVTLLPVSAAAAGWTKRINGEMLSAVNYGEFHVMLSAWDKGDDTYGGQGQYYYPPIDRTFHLKVSRVCSGEVTNGPFTGSPYIVAIGSIFLQDGTEPQAGGGFGAIAVAEGGTAGDGVRVWFDETLPVVEAFCENGAYDSFPARVMDGNFNIRTK